jgi:hypothetical protein
MALLEPEKKKRGILNPQERMGLDEGSSHRASTNRVGKMVEGTPLGMPKTPLSEIENPNETNNLQDPKKMKVKKKEPGVGSYQA